MGGTHGSLYSCRRKFDQRTLLPSGGLGKFARRKVGAAEADHIVERERILRRKIERYLESFDGGFGVTSIGVDPAAAAPCPSRSAIKRESLANDEVRGVQLAEQRESIAEHRKNHGVSRKSPRLFSKCAASCEIVLRIGTETIGYALNVGPGRQRRRQCVLRIVFHGAIQQFKRTCIAFVIKREHPRHGPEREVVRGEVGVRLSQRVVYLRKPEAWLKRGGDPGGQLLL